MDKDPRAVQPALSHWLLLQSLGQTYPLSPGGYLVVAVLSQSTMDCLGERVANDERGWKRGRHKCMAVSLVPLDPAMLRSFNCVNQ